MFKSNASLHLKPNPQKISSTQHIHFFFPIMLVLYFSIQTHCILLYKLRAFHSYKCGPLCSESTTGPGWFSTGRPTRDCGSAGSPVSCCPFSGLDRKNNSQWGHEDKCHTVLAHKLLKWTSDWFPGLTFRISQAFKKKLFL